MKDKIEVINFVVFCEFIKEYISSVSYKHKFEGLIENLYEFYCFNLAANQNTALFYRFYGKIRPRKRYNTAFALQFYVVLFILQKGFEIFNIHLFFAQNGNSGHISRRIVGYVKNVANCF